MGRDPLRRRPGLAPLMIVAAVLGLAVFAVLRGPDLYARVTHPLTHQDEIAQAAASQGVDPYLVAAVINVESGFRDAVVSPAGAVGLMQVMPSTAQAVAARIGLHGKMSEAALSDPVTNIRVGTAYLAELLARYHDDGRLALAAYNAGISNADGWAKGWSPGMGDSAAVRLIDFPETVDYVGEVLAQVRVYRALYPDVFPATRK
jgi:soluble lytic murein transglycosylase